MAQSPRHLLGPHALSTSSGLKPLRSSNDYFPDIPSSHAYHVYTNVLVSQFVSGFTIADFDMFQTHAFLGSSSTLAQPGPFHASLRALGNGPVTVTDVPEHCESVVFMRLAGRGRDGKTIALNAATPIEVMDERCFDEVAQRGDGRGLRGYSNSEFGVVIGIWNVRDNGGWVKDAMSLDDVTSMFKSKEIVSWSHSRQEVFLPQTDPASSRRGQVDGCLRGGPALAAREPLNPPTQNVIVISGFYNPLFETRRGVSPFSHCTTCGDLLASPQTLIAPHFPSTGVPSAQIPP